MMSKTSFFQFVGSNASYELDDYNKCVCLPMRVDSTDYEAKNIEIR
jgi:hypothetical protein